MWLLLLILLFLFIRRAKRKADGRKTAKRKQTGHGQRRYTPPSSPPKPSIFKKKEKQGKGLLIYGDTHKPTSTTLEDLQKEFKGVQGEDEVVHYLRCLLKDGIILRNIYLPLPGRYDETTEIDILLLHERGVFCFEVKNYTGMVYGDSQRANWRVYPYGSRKGESKYYTFFNPVLQNAVHVSALSKFIPDDYIDSIVVFGQRTTLKYQCSGSDCECTVCNIKQLPNKLKLLMESPRAQLTEDELEAIFNKLKPYLHVSDAVKAQHVAYVKSRQQAQ